MINLSRIFFVNVRISILVLVFSINSFGLDAQTNKPIERVVPVQAGNVELTSGKAKINLNQSAIELLSNLSNSDYVVMLTPVGQCGNLKIQSKDNNSFEVGLQEAGALEVNTNLVFSYVVFVTGSIIEIDQDTKLATSIFDK